MKIMMTLKEAAAETGLSYYMLRKLALSGGIFSVRSGSKFLLNRKSLMRYLGEIEDEEPAHVIQNTPNDLTERDTGEGQS